MPLERQEIHGFLGVNLRKDRTSLEDSEMARAINGDFHAQTGTVVLRLPRTKLFSTALTDLVIRRLARVNGARYQVAGQSLYRDQVKIIDGLLSPTLITTITPFRPLLDTTIWAFIADDAVMRKASTTLVRNWGIVAPTEAPPVTATLGGTLSGAYHAVFTYIRFDGTKVAHESNPSPPSATVSLSNGFLAVGPLPLSDDPQVNGIGIYRTVADGTDHLLDSRVPIPETSEWGITHALEGAFTTDPVNAFFWPLPRQPELVAQFLELSVSQAWELNGLLGYTGTSEDANGFRATSLWERAAYVTTQVRHMSVTSSMADNDLGAEVERDNDPPPLASWGTEFQGHIFLTRDAANPDRLWYSKRFRPEAVPVDNFLQLGNPDDPLQCAVPLSGLLAVLSKLTKYRVVGNSTSGFVGQEAISTRGTVAPMACVATELGLVFVAHDGVYRTNVIAEDEEISGDIEALFRSETVNDFAPINFAAASTMAAAYFKNRYYLSLPTGDSLTPNVMAVYSRITGKWYFFDHPARSLFYEKETDQLLAGFGDGLVYVIESGTTAEPVTIDWQTKDYFGQTLEVRKLFQWVKVDVDTLGEKITAEVYIDGVLKRSTQIVGARGKSLVALPSGCIGYTWRLRVTYTGTKRVKWYGAEAIWAPLEAA